MTVNPTELLIDLSDASLQDRMDIAWKAPDSDGGAEIEKYIIEKREKGKQWQKASEVGGLADKATIQNLQEGKEYEFRVTAVNKGGNGQPSEASKAQLAKARFVAPRIDKMSLKTITVKAGQPVNIDVSYLAAPLPYVSWSLAGKEVKDDRFSFSLTDRVANLSLKASKRQDTGKYTIKMTNDTGSDSADIEVVVLGLLSAFHFFHQTTLSKSFRTALKLHQPDQQDLSRSKTSRSEYHLKCFDGDPIADRFMLLCRDSVTIAWKKPDDDGGRPIE